MISMPNLQPLQHGKRGSSISYLSAETSAPTLPYLLSQTQHERGASWGASDKGTLAVQSYFGETSP